MELRIYYSRSVFRFEILHGESIMSQWFALVALFAFTLSPCVAQQTATPGKEHEFLKEQVGEWDVVFDGNMTGKSVYSMAHNGLWLESKVAIDMPQGKFTGQGLDSYDAKKGKYIGIWVDSMSTSPIMMEGTMDAASKTITMVGKGPDPEGNTVDYKMSTLYQDKDTHYFKLWVGNIQGTPTMTATYKRKK
jgi:hypothetical protein